MNYLNDPETEADVLKYNAMMDKFNALGSILDENFPVKKMVKKFKIYEESKDFLKSHPWASRDQVKVFEKETLSQNKIKSEIKELDYFLSNFVYDAAQSVIMRNRWLANECAPKSSDTFPGMPFLIIAALECDKATTLLLIKCGANLDITCSKGKNAIDYILQKDMDQVEKDTRISWLVDSGAKVPEVKKKKSKIKM